MWQNSSEGNLPSGEGGGGGGGGGGARVTGVFCNTSRFLMLQNWVAAFSFWVPLADGASHNILLLETCLMLQLTNLYKNSHF